MTSICQREERQGDVALDRSGTDRSAKVGPFEGCERSSRELPQLISAF
jgi:hypothetical protein